MNEMKYIIINKNRGWRGLAEVDILNEGHGTITSHIFSFSQAMWEDMIVRNIIVIASEDYYYVIRFEDTGKLPKPTQQRSVLIKSYLAKIEEVNKYEKSKWTSALAADWVAIRNFIKNKNNHTTSDWNCIRLKSYTIYIVNRLERRRVRWKQILFMKQ